MNTFDGHGICHDDYDCRYNTACQGWCAWNSQKGCAKSCHEEVVVQESPKSECRRGRAYWQCQSSEIYLPIVDDIFQCKKKFIL